METYIRFKTTQLSPPNGLTATPIGAGGTFPAGTYFWEVTALTALGETTVSNEATAAIVLNGSCTLQWVAPQGVVTGYKLYRGTVSGAENVLVATIPAGTTAAVDTGSGGAGTPPASNTATVSDYTLMTGFGWFTGFSLNEPTGTNTASVDIRDGAQTIAKSNLTAGGSETEITPGRGIQLDSNLTMHVTSGQFGGVVYARIPPVC